MRKKITIVALSLVTALSGVAPAEAFPSVSPPKIEAPQQVQNVQYWRRDRDRWDRRGRWDRRARWDRWDRWDRRNRWERRRWRRGPSPGAIIGGFAMGAIVGSALARPRYVVPPRRFRPVGSSAHVRWCYARFRSYRSWDNTFQPFRGPRRQCISPYW